MKRIKRKKLPQATSQYLLKRQREADKKLLDSTLDTTADWKLARQTKGMAKVLTVLHAMADVRQRCMYCLDSHGSDIEHFRPKTNYPKRMYQWSNLLLCCAHCGRLKGNQFPTSGHRALLVDPTKENPWHYLDFNPETGNICARFDVHLNRWSDKGEKTVEVLQLDRREALSAGYLKTLNRLSDIVANALATGLIDVDQLTKQLTVGDDHGLLEWCFSDRSHVLKPFRDLLNQQPDVWIHCAKALKAWQQA